ncbi:Stk1 family PASTA domain-containing Ser/Thr kinase [Peribacillus cavernae]|uniref:Serine/threonine-protein kinase PrkC n=1 Tax=Peribacillus cavernae TaxID=1674310 RepID=A0A3S0VQ86_9BACI|nr:Stk1 family PASTA domain-containing Ser/Thr kinase [Peribacillus cavernae]MDQ0217125.1 serine/threonine-protein kinase [Peribacillus cavernae]RUQ30398.1 Stk1 family PASTA domain-containing Ser/Thr kinase [Peribacillus cavernae]
MLIGRRINGRYKLLDMVGGGGMANVYLAMDMILEREVALKILRMDFSNDEEFIKRFNREAQSATSLAHSNIVSIYDVGEEDDIYYIVMEYVKGLTLKQYIQKYYPIPVEKALDIMKQITDAISHAHHNGIIHRDIKPQNILIDDSGNVKITDFGIAMALSATNITQTNAVLGSVHYLSPEQARGGMANKKSDIYSLGIVMFELMTGRLPFSGESAVSIALKHLQTETPSPKRWNPDIPQTVENIILKATAKDSFYRYDSVDDMQDDIRTALDPERNNEKPFVIPEDAEATKAIPIITNDDSISGIDETITRRPLDEEDTQQAIKTSKKKKDKKQKSKDGKKKSRLPAILVSTFLLLIILGILAITVFPNVFASNEITVPDVKGEELDDAISLLVEAKLNLGDTLELEDEEIAEGKVIKTDPEKGDVVKEGTEINIYQSIGKEKLEVTDYTGRNIEDVKPLLTGMGFKEVIVTEQFDNSGKGTILSQNNPTPGTDVVVSETVFDVTVSKGPDKITLKDLTKFNKESLQVYANEVGIIIREKEEYNDSIKEGMVISQIPGAYTRIDKGSTVEAVISKGKEEIPPKVVTKEIVIEYVPEVPEKPQEIQIFIEDMTRDMTEPIETLNITESTKKTLEFTVTHDRKAGFKVMRDNNVIMDEVVPYPE